jgi:hypothetical protein
MGMGNEANAVELRLFRRTAARVAALPARRSATAAATTPSSPLALYISSLACSLRLLGRRLRRGWRRSDGVGTRWSSAEPATSGAGAFGALLLRSSRALGALSRQAAAG